MPRCSMLFVETQFPAIPRYSMQFLVITCYFVLFLEGCSTRYSTVFHAIPGNGISSDSMLFDAILGHQYSMLLHVVACYSRITCFMCFHAIPRYSMLFHAIPRFPYYFMLFLEELFHAVPCHSMLPVASSWKLHISRRWPTCVHMDACRPALLQINILNTV